VQHYIQNCILWTILPGMQPEAHGPNLLTKQFKYFLAVADCFCEVFWNQTGSNRISKGTICPRTLQSTTLVWNNAVFPTTRLWTQRCKVLLQYSSHSLEERKSRLAQHPNFVNVSPAVLERKFQQLSAGKPSLVENRCLIRS